MLCFPCFCMLCCSNMPHYEARSFDDDQRLLCHACRRVAVSCLFCLCFYRPPPRSLSMHRGVPTTPRAAIYPDSYSNSSKDLYPQVALKCADLGHLAGSLSVHQRWLAGLEEEFFRQGDREKAAGLPVSPLMDRGKQGITKSQVRRAFELYLNCLSGLTSAWTAGSRASPRARWVGVVFGSCI